jgi:hypothetical protein
MQYMNMRLSSLSIYCIFNKIEQIYHGESVQPFNNMDQLLLIDEFTNN